MSADGSKKASLIEDSPHGLPLLWVRVPPALDANCNRRIRGLLADALVVILCSIGIFGLLGFTLDK